MNRRVKRLAAESVFDLYRNLNGNRIGKDDLLEIYLIGYYQGVADTVVETEKKRQSIFKRLAKKFVGLFVLPAQPQVKHFENDWRFH